MTDKVEDVNLLGGWPDGLGHMCPFCKEGQRFAVDKLGVYHEKPSCQEYKQMSCQDFLLACKEKMPTQLWYFSFASEHKFLGGIIVEGHGFDNALYRINYMGINPGGEAVGLPFPEDYKRPADKWHNRLLSQEQIEECGRESGDTSFGYAPPEELRKMGVPHVHEEDNKPSNWN
jgi:hypothetical protein